MERVKCGQCGLVNWQGAVRCARCKGSLAVGVNPFENGTATKGGFNPLVVGFAAVVLAGISFGVYQTIAPAAPPEAPKVQAADNAPAAYDQQKVMQMVQESEKADIEKTRKWQADIQKGLEMPKFNKELMQKSAEQFRPKMQRLPTVVPGGFGPPGAGVPYHTR